MLETEFHAMQVQNDLVKIETKVRNIRFIGELTKFAVVAPQLALECLSTCLDTFIGHNLELIANLLETAGPYLTRHADESVTLKINNMLDIMWRLKEKETLPQKQMYNLEGAYYMCRPHLAGYKTVASQIMQQRKVDSLTLMQQYI